MTEPDDTHGGHPGPSGCLTPLLFCANALVALVVFYIWVNNHFAYYYRNLECGWDAPGPGYPTGIVACIAFGSALLLVIGLLFGNVRRPDNPVSGARIAALGLATLILVGVLAVILGFLMGAGMQCFD